MNISRPSRAVGIAVFSAATALQVSYALLVYSMWGHTFLNSDAVSHTYISRLLWLRVENIGGVWLPLFHILESPFTLVPQLYSTGFSGVIVNSIATGLTSLVLYRMLPNRYGVFLALLYAGNILTLTYSATPAQEPTAILLGVSAIYYFREYLVTDRRGSFLKMSVVLTIGEFARYEVWVLAFLLVLLFAFREVKKNRKNNIAFSHLAFWGAFLWLLWETAIFRDPLAFLHAPSRLGIYGFLSTPSYQSLADIASRADIQYELVATVIASSLIAFRNRTRFLAVGSLCLLALTIPLQTPPLLNIAFGSGDNYPIFYSGVIAQRSVWEHIAGIAHSTILISNYGVSGSDYLSVFAGVDQTHIIDEYDTVFVNASARPWSYADYVVIRICQGGCTALLELNQKYWGAFFNYLYYFDGTWRSVFDLHYQLAYTDSGIMLYHRVT